VTNSVDIVVPNSPHGAHTQEEGPNAREGVAAEWDFEGVGIYPVTEELESPPPRVVLSVTHADDEPGTSHTPYGLAQNLARVRAVVYSAPRQMRSLNGSEAVPRRLARSSTKKNSKFAVWAKWASTWVSPICMYRSEAKRSRTESN
jgi:hypothetical protein